MKRIVIIGPESTGKSTLTQQLARYFNAIGIDEYARQYLSEIGRPYVQADLLAIGKGQMALEDAAARRSGNGLIFCDTDLNVLKVWSESKYGACDEWILKEIAARRYDFYILTDIDMPWEEDPMREHPEPAMRQHFFDTYKDIVVQSGVPFVIVNGNEKERVEQAVAAITSLYSADTITRL